MTTKRRFALGPFLILAVITAFFAYSLLSGNTKPVPLSINQVADGIRDGSITKIDVNGNNLTLNFSNGTQGTSIKEGDATLMDQLVRYGLTPTELSQNG